MYSQENFIQNTNWISLLCKLRQTKKYFYFFLFLFILFSPVSLFAVEIIMSSIVLGLDNISKYWI